MSSTRARALSTARSAVATPLRAAITLGVIGVLLAAGLAIGWANAATHSNQWAAKSATLEKQLGDITANASALADDRDKWQSEAEDAASAAADLDSREQSVAAAEQTLASKQKRFDDEQKQVESTQLYDGVHVVGTDTKPGVYTIGSTSDCYYAWKTGTGSDADIVDNNIVNGSATVTLKSGEVFETSNCGTWKKTG